MERGRLNAYDLGEQLYRTRGAIRFAGIAPLASYISLGDLILLAFSQPQVFLFDKIGCFLWGGAAGQNILARFGQYVPHIEEVEQVVGRSSSQDFAVTMLLSDECTSFQALQAQSSQLQELAPLRAWCGVGRVWKLEGLRPFANQAGWLKLSRLVSRAARHYQAGEYLNYNKTVQRFERTSRRGDFLDNEAKQHLAEFIYCAMQCQIDPKQSAASWRQVLETHGGRLLAGVQPEEPQVDIIGQVTSFVDQNYMHDISIGQIAEQIHITPNYLSTLFHKQMGTTFIQYLTKTRMLRGKELLTDPNIKIQQVAEQVGYSGARYFSKLFVKFVGCYPSEYRSRFD